MNYRLTEWEARMDWENRKMNTRPVLSSFNWACLVLAVVILVATVVVAMVGCGGPLQDTACTVTHNPSGTVWQLEGPPVGHPQNPTIGLPDQWTSGYYHFASSGSTKDAEFENIMKSPGIVSVPIHQSTVVFEEPNE